MTEMEPLSISSQLDRCEVLTIVSQSSCLYPFIIQHIILLTHTAQILSTHCPFTELTTEFTTYI